MEIGTAEISRIIKEQIRDYDKTVEIQEVGTVLSTGDGIARHPDQRRHFRVEPRHVDKPLQAAEAGARSRENHQRHRRYHRHRLEIVHRVERQRADHHRRHRVSVVQQEGGVAVRRGLGDLVGRDRAACPGPVLDHHRLARDDAGGF